MIENTNQYAPFLSVIKYGKKEYVGVIINQDSNVTSFYDMELITTELDKQHFIKIAETWWWESNRKIPIITFCRNEISSFAYAITTAITKDVSILHGPVVRLSEFAEKRIKRKTVQLVRRIR